MHELSLSRAVVSTVVRHAQGRPVRAVEVRVGRLRQVAPDTLQFYFPFAARGTVCEAAELHLDVVEATLRCRACECEWAIEAPAFRCPSCRGGDVDITRGDEFEVASIEVECSEEEEEAQCIARK